MAILLPFSRRVSGILPPPPHLRQFLGGGERWAPLADLAASNSHHALEAVTSVTFLRRLSRPLLSSSLLRFQVGMTGDIFKCSFLWNGGRVKSLAFAIKKKKKTTNHPT